MSLFNACRNSSKFGDNYWICICPSLETLAFKKQEVTLLNF